MKRRGFLGFLFVAPFAKAVAKVVPKPRSYSYMVYLRPPVMSMAACSFGQATAQDIANAALAFYTRKFNDFEKSWKENCTPEKFLQL